MKLEAMICPACSAPVQLYPESLYCRCEYCGRQFMVNRDDAMTAQLAELDLKKVVHRTEFLEADKRLEYLAKDLVVARESVAQAEELLHGAESDLKRLKAKNEKEMETAQQAGGIIGLVGAVLWYLVIFVLEGSDWYLAFAGAVVCSVLVWGATYDYKAAADDNAPAMRAAQAKRAEAQKGVEAAQGYVEDLLVEKDLCERRVHNYRVRE